MNNTLQINYSPPPLVDGGTLIFSLEIYRCDAVIGMYRDALLLR